MVTQAAPTQRAKHSGRETCVSFGAHRRSPHPDMILGLLIHFPRIQKQLGLWGRSEKGGGGGGRRDQKGVPEEV